MPGSPEGFNDLSEPVDASLTTEEIKASSTVDTKLVKHLQSIEGSLKSKKVPLDVCADISFAPQGQKSHEGLVV
eukprot:3027320-Amphidinium_carterae.1